MVIHDPFFWFTLLFGLFIACQIVAAAIFVLPAYRSYSKVMKQSRSYKSTLKLRLLK